ncbi:MAG: hypothetical protein V2I76_02305 [Roseobacter sp.]|jgi:hypothetical protein|nr:hypothetical protein [Roseobacter sp.]
MAQNWISVVQQCIEKVEQRFGIGLPAGFAYEDLLRRTPPGCIRITGARPLLSLTQYQNAIRRVPVQPFIFVALSTRYGIGASCTAPASKVTGVKLKG